MVLVVDIFLSNTVESSKPRVKRSGICGAGLDGLKTKITAAMSNWLYEEPKMTPYTPTTVSFTTWSKEMYCNDGITDARDKLNSKEAVMKSRVPNLE